MDSIKTRIKRVKAKQDVLRKAKSSFLGKETQTSFDTYIGGLSHDTTCKHMQNISGIMTICDNALACRFKGEHYHSFGKDPKPECKRERLLKFEDLLKT